VTQVDRAIAALLEGWLSPKQLTAASGRANPNGIKRDALLEATRRGLVWRSVWVKDAVTGRPYKMHHLIDPEAERGSGRGVRLARSLGNDNASASGVSGETGVIPTGSDGGESAPRPLEGGDRRNRAATPRPSPSRWQDVVGVSGATRKTDEGRLF